MNVQIDTDKKIIHVCGSEIKYKDLYWLNITVDILLEKIDKIIDKE